jgi:predicted carbohydrate-binding protein with CBM5 and CBM33 domain
MATHEISLLGPQTVPDSTGNVYQQPYPILATNDVWGNLIFVFADAGTTNYLYGVITIPQNYVGTAVIVFIWTATATSGNVLWGFDYRVVGGDDTTSLDQATAVESVTVQDVAPTATDRRLRVTVALTSANLAAGSTLEFRISRNPSNGSDTMAASAQLFDCLLSYADV